MMLRKAFRDTYARCYAYTGAAPLVMLANEGMKKALIEEEVLGACVPNVVDYSDEWKWPNTTFFYGGVEIRCVLKTDVPTFISLSSFAHEIR